MKLSLLRLRPQSAHRRMASRTRRLRFEALEQRIEPAPIFWVGGSGDWTDPTHWNTNTVPGPGDEVLIDTGGIATISVTSGAQSVDSIEMTGTDSLAILGGSLTLTNASDINDLQMSGGSLTSNLLTTLLGTATVSNDSSWFGLFRNDATLTIMGDPNFTDVSLNNTGTILDAGARLDLGGNTTITNAVGGLFDITANGDFGFLANAAGVNNSFHNFGTLERSGTGTASFDGVTFVNEPGATIALTAGTLLVNTTGTLAAGPLALSPGTSLEFDIATNLAMSGNYSNTGTGHIDFTGGTLSLGPSPVSFNFGTGVFTVSGGSATFLNGTLNNSGFVHLADASDPDFTNVTLNNSGTILNGGRIDFGGDTTVHNLGAGTFNLTRNGTFDFLNVFAGANNLFHNTGTLRRSGTGTASFNNVLFQNDPGAVIDITAGDLLVNTNGTLAAGPLSIATGSTLRFDAGTNLTLSGTYATTGAGHVDFNGGTLSLGFGTVTANFASGVFNISGANATIQDGTLNNAGFIRIADLSDPNFNAVTLNNSGTILDGGRVDFGGSTTLNNQTSGTFDVTRNGTFDFLNILAGTNNLFHNAGTLRRSASGTASFGGVAFQNDIGGAIDITAGTLSVNTSGTFAAGPLTVATGSTLRFDTGTNLTLNGIYSSTGGGHVDFVAGTLSLGASPVTFNFAPGIFTMSGGTTIQDGTLNNSGFLRIADASDPNFNAVTLNNSGTILAGGRIDFGGDTAIHNLASATFDITLNGSIDFLSNLAGSNNLFHNAGTLRRSGTGTASFNGVALQNDSGSLIDVTAGALQLNTSGQLAGGSINAATGTSVTINGGNFATSGSFTGTGGGLVNLTTGTLMLGAGGVSFNFPTNYFNWSGTATVDGGTLTNSGFIQFVGGNPQLSNAILDNAGSIINSGARLDFAGTSVLNNLAAGIIDVKIAGISDFTGNLGGAGSIIHNLGTFRHSGPGSLALGAIPFDTTGTVEVSAGTLILNTPVSQVSGTSLTGGTWDVSSGASLLLPGTTVISNVAVVVLRGTASAPAFDGLAFNIGSFALLEGRDFTTVGDFTGSGTLTLSAGSIFSANGAFTQTATGEIAFELGGTPASGLFGQILATGAAALDGSASFSINGYTPNNGDTFTLMTFPSHAGVFGAYNGLVPATGVFLTPTTTATEFGLNVLVDNLAPTSSVAAFPGATTNRPVFMVSWIGEDGVGGAGVASYDVYLSDNGGPFTPFLTNTTSTSTVFAGQVDHSYAFYTRATDVVGNIEDTPATADAIISVSRTRQAVVKLHTFTDADGDIYTVRLSGPGSLDAVLLDPDGDGHGSLDYLFADGTTTKSNITVTVKKNIAGGDGIVTIGDVEGSGALGTFAAKASDLIMNGLHFTGAVRSIKIRDILRPEPALASPELQTGALATDKLAITARNIVEGTSIQTPGVITSLRAADIGQGTIAAAELKKLKTTAGGMDSDLTIIGAVGPISVKGGGASGSWIAASFGPVSVKDGNFSAQLTSLTPAATLGRKSALASLKVTGGDFTAEIRVLGKAGAIKVSASKQGIGGNFNTGTICASGLASFTLSGNFVDSIVLAGADLGADFDFGGGDDSFAVGIIGAVKVGGNVTGSRSLIGAGFSRVGTVDTILGGTASTISSLKVTGTVDAGLHFAAGRFKSTPKLAGTPIDPATDVRFLVG